MAPGPAPGGPAPDVDVAGEVVARLPRWGRPEELTARHVHDPVVLRVPGEQLVAVAEEGRVRQAVVLEDDRPLHLTEDTVDSRRDPVLQPEVLVGEVPGHLA